MRPLYLLLCILIASNIYSQDTAKINYINRLVSDINTSALPAQKDTLFQDYPDLGLHITTYLTGIVTEKEVLKFQNHVISNQSINGVAQQSVGSNTFYYRHNKLIKVEEYILEKGTKREIDWYYENEKPLYYTVQSEKAEARAALLLTMSQGIAKQILSKAVTTPPQKQ